MTTKRERGGQIVERQGLFTVNFFHVDANVTGVPQQDKKDSKTNKSREKMCLFASMMEIESC